MGTYLGPLVLAALCLSAPALADSKCKAGCSHHGASGNIFAYVEGNTYTYSVEGTTTTSLTGTKGDGTKLSVKATVELSIQPNCAQFIKLSGVSVTGPDGKKYDDLKEIEKHPLRFNFHDGHIDAEVCSVEDDSQTALNVKRALLSLFQVAASQSFGSNAVTEIDVFGSCPTEFSFSKDGDVLIVRKERNLNRCAYREDFRSDILSVGYAGASPLQNTPLMASSLKSTQRIKNKIIDSAESVEEYFYRPLSNRDAGAKTVVETKIKLVSTKKQAPSSTAVTRQRSIIFDVPHVTTVPGNADAITKAMHKAHENMKTVVGESSARDFGDVVQVLRQSTKDDILKAFKESHHKSMFIEALIRTGTGDAVQAGVELIKQKEIKGATEKIWYMSLGFVRHATPGSLAAVASLIDGSSSRSLVLGAGALAGRYCREHDCDNKSEFNTLISKLAGPLGSSCKPKDKADENKIIASLKAIHNIHNLNDATAKIVSQCASDVSLPARIRVVALEAFHGDACIPKLRETALNILKNIEEDSEIRIKAYLALVDCPNGQVANALKEIIEKEPSYQVGAFIVSHLRNLRASANPDKESAKAQLGNIKPTKRFPNDLRKFSRNFEVSTLVDLLNIGASAESNVIFSQKSYVPRSASLNLTTDVFGHSVNLFELGLRAENIDRVLEHIFGPKGYVRSNNVREMFDESKDRLVGLAEKISARFAKSTRGKRSVSRDQINALSKKVSLGPKDFDAEVDIDFSVKIFGLESIWLNYQGGHVSPDSIVDKIFDGIDAGIDKAKKFNYDIQKHLQFLDTDLTYPTGLGVPLKLSATGNAVIHLKLDGKLDLHSILKDPLNAEAKLSIVPSAAVEVNGLMVVDAIVVQTGLKLSTTLHTATGSDVTVKILNGNGIDVNFGLPIPKQDLITLKSEIFNYKREEGQSEVNTPLTFNTKRKDYHGCFDQLNSFIGVTFCAEGGLPIETPTFNAAFFPLSGPAKLSVRAEKDDSGMTGYHLRALYDKKSPQKCSFEVSVDTPGSKTNRKVALILEGSTSPEYAVKAALTSPWKKLALEGQILDNDKKQMLVGKFINDKAEYSVNLGLDVTGTPDARTYAPVLEYVAPGGRKEALTGKDGKKQSVSIEGTITIEKKGDTWRKYKFNGIAVNTPVGKYGVDGSITKDSNLVAHDLKLSMDKTSANVKTDLQRLGPNAYKAHIEVVPNQSPDFSFAIDWDYKRENNQVDNKLIVAHGANLKATESRVTLIQQGNLKGDSLSNFDVSTKQKLTYPPLGIDGKLDAAATKKSANYDFFFKYDNKKVESKLSAKINQKAVGDYEVKFSAKVNDKGISIESMRSKPAADKAKGHHVLELTPGGKYEINSDVTYNFEKNNINYLGEHLIKLHQQPDIKISTAFVNNPNNFNTHCFVTYGDTKYLDSSAKLDRNAGSPSGSYKIIIKDYFDSHGELKYAGGKGSGSFVVDIPKVQRKIKGSAELSSSGSKHKLSADLLWNADKDPKQKIHFETDSDLAPKAINSKNTIVIMDWKTLVNIKHEMTGTNRDGTVKKELDVTIPNGRRFLMRCDHGLHLKPDQPGSGDLLVLLEDHNGSAVRSSELKVSAKGVDVKHGAFDGAVDFTYKSPSGKDVEAKLNAKNTYAGDKKWVAEGKGSIKSALLSKPVNLEFNSEVTPNLVSYKLKGQNVLSLEYDIQGKVVTGLEKDKHSRHADTSIDLKLPSDHIKNIKIKTDWTMTAEEGSPCQVGFKHLWDMLEKIKNQKGLKLASTLSMLVPNLVPSCEVKALNEISWDEKTTKLNGALKADLRRGSTKVILTLPNDKPRSVQTSWVHELDQDPPKLSSTVNAQWDEKKEVKLDFKVEGLKDLSDIHAKLSGTTNVNQKHDFTIDVANKRKSERATKTDVSLSLDDKKVKVGVDLDMAEKSPKFDINVEHPGGKLRVASKTERKSDKEIKNEGEIQWPYQGGGKLAWEVEAKAESVDNFDIKGKIDSEKLKLNKYEIAVASKPGDKKQITFTCKSADQNILSGSTNYQFKEEGKLWTMEGSGNVQIKNEARSTHFKYTRQQLDLSQDHEIGFEHKLDVDLGGKESIQLVRKLSNTQHRFINVYCDKEKKCARIEYDHNIKKQDFVDVDRELKIVFDLKSLGVPHDFNFQHNRVRHGRIIDIDSVLNMDSGAEKTTISSKVYAHDKSAGVIITLPKRTIEALAELEIPNGKQEGSFKAALSLWLDKKRQPNLKSAVIILGNVAQSQQDGASLTGEARFVHPGAKELSATTKVIVGGPKNLLNAQADLDVFADQNQKVVLEAKVAALEIPSGRNITVNVGAKSKGLSLDVELLGHVALSPEVISASQFLVYQDQDEKKGSRNVGAYAMLSKEKLILVATIPGSVLLKVKSDLKITRDLQSIDSTIDLFGMKPVVVQGEVKDLNSAIFSVFKKDDPKKKLSLKGGFGWGQVAEVRATKQDGDAKNDLFYVTVALDESHFLQTEYGGSYDNVKATIDGLRKEGSAFANQARIQIADAVLEGNKNVRDIADKIKQARPNIKPVTETYQKELKTLADELANEKLAKEITDIIKEAVARITAILEKIQAEFQKYAEILEKPLKQLFDTVKQWVVKLNEVYGSVAEAAVGACDAVAQLLANYMSKIVELVRKHEEEIKRIATVVGQGIQDVGRIVSKAVGQIRHDVEDFVKLFMEQLKALPIYEVLKERYQELKKYQIPDQAWSMIRDLIDALSASMPTPEVGDLFQAISGYAEKHLKHEKVDDVAELKAILNSAIAALKSLVNLVKNQISQSDLDKLVKFAAVPLPGSSWFQLPIFAPIHLSPLKWLQSGDLPSLSEAYYTYRPTLNPLDWVPPYKMYGILVDSHNFYTFDRKYYNFNGACSYVLAQDFVDGNFSLVVNLEGGKFKSILLNDAKDSIELESDMSILVNGKPQDFPVNQGDLSAWRRYDSANLRSASGVFVTCDLKRQVCQFFLSGFYFGKTRGLLGNMNYEEFDDLALPNGKIASKIADFGNAWKVNSECSDVPNVEHDHAKESYGECNRFFSGSSPLSSCFPYINPAAFRTACEHVATEAKSEDAKKKAACNLAFAYTQSCRYEHVKVDIPASCASCTAGSSSSPIALGDTVSVKAPQTMADIILVVEQIKPNEEVFKDLVVPLIASLSNELKGKGITDVHFSLLGFGAPEQKWPSHYTSGGELSFEGKTKNIWFGAPTTYEKPLDTVEKKIKWIKHQIDLETGNLKLVDAFTEAGEFPYRAGAVKSIIGVMGQGCEGSLLPLSLMQVRTHLASYRYRDQGISLHVISPLSDLALDNDKPSADIVGFDSDNVYTIGDDKKKPFDGNKELRDHLKNESDTCIKVALGTYGSAFSSKNFLASKPPQRKQFVSVISKRVTDSLTGGEIVQDCKCSLQDGLHPKVNCKVISRTDKRHG